jgi:UDP:flavonoid glycosyltransferase YjiC (YdhE family)
MTLLVISPDYASHALPLLSLARAWHERGHRVVVASGPAVAPLIKASGMEYVELLMSRGGNPGVLRSEAQRRDEASSLAGFFEATRRGMLETLRYQAVARATDLLWRPEHVARATMRVVERVDPEEVLVDHLAFASVIGLRAMGVPYGDVVLGHPTALTVRDEVYGVPSAWPSSLTVEPTQLADLRAVASGVRDAFTFAFERVLATLDPAAGPVGDAFAVHGDVVLFVYPERLHDRGRTRHLPAHEFLGSAARTEQLPEEIARWLDDGDGRPLVVVSFGTFLSARSDVLARVAAALRRVDARVAMATGTAEPAALGELPDDWLVRPVLPQVALLERASLLVTHGGNNSVTEALTYGVPLLVMPFSTDQFDAAAAIEGHAAGVALDPNHAPRPLIAGSVRGLLRHPLLTPQLIGRELRADPGPEIAFRAMRKLRDRAGSNGSGAAPAATSAGAGVA